MALTSVGTPVDVAVVGAGVVGLAVAYNLAERGLATAVLDRAGIAAGASGVQPGGVRQQWASSVNCLLARESLGFYREIGTRLGTRLDPHFSACGYAFIAHSNEHLAALAANVALQRGLGVPASILSPEETAEVVPELDPSAIRGAAFCSEDGYFDRAQEPVEAFAEAAWSRGARLEIAELRGLARDGAGWRLLSAGGPALLAAQVVVAAAAESPSLLRGLGVELPIVPEPRHLFLSDPISVRLLEPLVVATEIGFAAKQLADGRLLASDLHARGDPGSEAAAWRATVRAGCETLLPRLQAASFPHLVSGLYDVTPDHNPLLGRVPGAEGVWVAAGFSGHGFMLAPAVGRLLAEAVARGQDAELPAEFAPDRFWRTRPAAETQII